MNLLIVSVGEVMPSSKAVLRDIHDLALNPKVAYKNVRPSGRLQSQHHVARHIESEKQDVVADEALLADVEVKPVTTNLDEFVLEPAIEFVAAEPVQSVEQPSFVQVVEPEVIATVDVVEAAEAVEPEKPLRLAKPKPTNKLKETKATQKNNK